MRSFLLFSFVVFTFGIQNLVGQNASVKWSPEQDYPKGLLTASHTIVHADDEQYYSYIRSKKVHTLVSHTHSNRQKWEKKIEFPSDAINKLRYDGCYFTEEGGFLLWRARDRKAKVEQYWALPFGKNGPKEWILLFDGAKEIQTFVLGDLQAIDGDGRQMICADGKFFMLIPTNEVETKDNEEFHVVAFGADLQREWGRVVSLPYSDKEWDLWSSQILNDKLYLLGKLMEGNEDNACLVYEIGSSEERKTTVKIPDGMILSSIDLFNNNHKQQTELAGIARYVKDSVDIRGIFRTVLDFESVYSKAITYKLSADQIPKTATELSQQNATNALSKRKARRGEKGKPNFWYHNLYSTVDEEDRLHMVMEPRRSWVVTSTTTQNGTKTTTESPRFESRGVYSVTVDPRLDDAVKLKFIKRLVISPKSENAFTQTVQSDDPNSWTGVFWWANDRSTDAKAKNPTLYDKNNRQYHYFLLQADAENGLSEEERFLKVPYDRKKGMFLDFRSILRRGNKITLKKGGKKGYQTSSYQVEE